MDFHSEASAPHVRTMGVGVMSLPASRVRRALTWVTMVALLAAVAACGGGDDGGTPGTAPSSSESTTSTIPEFVPAPIAWRPCEDGLECADVTVPVDYAEPTGPTVVLSAQRAPASGQRTGAVFVNPGGPGGATADFVRFLKDDLPATVTEQFDLVGVEWRGSAASDFDCGVPIPELYAADATIEDQGDAAALIDVSRRYADGCQAGAGELLAHIGTSDAARDLDAVRAAMGDEQISFLGVSYGSLLGQVYAQQFPTRVRAMVIDGITEAGTPGVEAATAQAASVERVFDAFAAACDAEPNCPLAGDTRGAVERLIAQVESAPLEVEGGQLGPGELMLALVVNLYGEGGWPDLSYAIEAGLAGDGAPLDQLAQDYMSLADFDIYFSVFCIDQDWPDDPNALLEAGKTAAGSAPLFGEALVNDYVRCSVWPVEEQPLPAVTAPGTPPILVVSTTNDPATPHDAAVRTADRLESAVLLTVEGDRHGAVGRGITCVDEHVTHYLVNVIPPPEGTVCAAD
jgi:pimeloyl-ACP methyl ester carboxylesterase